MSRQSLKETEKQDARKELLEILKPGDTVFCVLRHVSRSGMQREISLFTDGMRCIEMRCIDWYAERVLEMRRGKRDGLIVGGCGMDMGHALVYSLSYRLFPDGFKVEGIGRNGDTSGWDKDGGYALKTRWI